MSYSRIENYSLNSEISSTKQEKTVVEYRVQSTEHVRAFIQLPGIEKTRELEHATEGSRQAEIYV